MSIETYPEWYVDVKNLSPNRVTRNFLEFMNLKLEDCKGKNIRSIWWGFWIFEMDAAKAWARVTAVDPLFSNDDLIEWKIKENIDWLKEKKEKENTELCRDIRMGIMKALSEVEDENERLKLEERLKRHVDRQHEIDDYINRRAELLEHLENRGQNQKQYWLILNPSSWDNIRWIDDSSQDMVIIWHTLSHIYNSAWNIKKFLEEWRRILENKWKLWLIDYCWTNSELEDKLKKTEYKQYYKEIKGSFVCCFDKEWLSKFLQKDFDIFYS